MTILGRRSEGVCARVLQGKSRLDPLGSRMFSSLLHVLIALQIGAEILGKPEEYISVTLNYNETLTFAGTFDPAFNLNIVSRPVQFAQITPFNNSQIGQPR